MAKLKIHIIKSQEIIELYRGFLHPSTANSYIYYDLHTFSSSKVDFKTASILNYIGKHRKNCQQCESGQILYRSPVRAEDNLVFSADILEDVMCLSKKAVVHVEYQEILFSPATVLDTPYLFTTISRKSPGSQWWNAGAQCIPDTQVNFIQTRASALHLNDGKTLPIAGMVVGLANVLAHSSPGIGKRLHVGD